MGGPATGLRFDPKNRMLRAAERWLSTYRRHQPAVQPRFNMTTDVSRGAAASGGTPLVSIALCTYNSHKFLVPQLESLLAQTYANIEIVVSDDASSDDTLALLEGYVRRDARVRVAANARNVGFGRNFENVIRNCRGAYIAPCDHDDIWLPDKVAALVAVIRDRQLAYCDSTLIDETGVSLERRMSDIVPMLSTDDPLSFAFGNCASGHAMLFRRELVNRALPVPEGFFYDWWIAAVAAAAGGVIYCPRSLVLYRQHGANITDARLAQMQVDAGLAPRRDPSAARSTDGAGKLGSDASRRREDKLRYLREAQARLAALAQLTGPSQPFIARLHELWRARETQWVSPRLGWLMLRNRKRLFAVTRLPERRQRRYCRRFFFGLRLARLAT